MAEKTAHKNSTSKKINYPKAENIAHNQQSKTNCLKTTTLTTQKISKGVADGLLQLFKASIG